MHIRTPLTARIVATDNVPLLGQSFASNFDLSKSKAIEDAKAKFPSLIEELFESKALDKDGLIFSLDVFSASTNSSIYSYRHVGKNEEKSLTAGNLTDTTISRTGSVSKLFTAYAFIAKAGMEVFSHPVTRYLPELAGNKSENPLERIDWDEITVGTLLSHQAGTGGVSEGLILEGLKHYRDLRRPTTTAHHTALYSDGGFSLLTIIFSRLTGKPYGEAVKEILFEPLGLDQMSSGAPNGSDIDAIDRRPVDNSSSWGGNPEFVAGSGGIYGSTRDFRLAGLSILNSEILSAATTKAWMKPLSGTGSLVELVGAPWEIQRLMIPATPGSNRTRLSDLYTKAGGNGDYTAIIALSPDHGIGFSLLVAGSSATPARWPLRGALGETFIPAAEAAAAENAKESFTGTFVAEGAEGTNLTITFDEGKPGLGLDSLYFEGVDIRSQILGSLEPFPMSVRLYPAGITSSKSLSALYKSKGKISVKHTAVISPLPLTPRADVEGGKGGLFDNSQAWMSIGQYGSGDEFVFNLVDGKLESVTSIALRDAGVEGDLKRVD
ncbi:uncharacterized protein NECHADRAFT_105590 [Fusarium vanettenii 77-13-4]|uniref:Uncharacterized protein n=1 Tax=Fusarium vanettenii (strain ATCC MYA-4622 / CBS 123669 / FGSC 9596 / NRRL 45880 / 77-13-4) TaxID=660122 RepID=C7ZEY7_FUSV7|nr:uncharacterized protein NECHADRAFT_105590 [Fusarium vanettenii 77-13-4]EEU37479.1 hypothetical protein NECHADRAFT_105590 [Fusarium vanettenii 77-13-4]